MIKIENQNRISRSHEPVGSEIKINCIPLMYMPHNFKEIKEYKSDET